MTNLIAYTRGCPEWDTLPKYETGITVYPTEADIHAYGQICYDDKALYLHLAAEEKDIRAEMNDPMGQTCEDSCLEFFFRPDPKEMRYFNLEYNLNCCPFIGFGTSIEDLVRLHPLQIPFKARANRTENGWEVFYQIPYSFIRLFFPSFSPKSGDSIYANFYKCGDKTALPHYYAWKQPANRPHGFHCPECFGEMIFE